MIPNSVSFKKILENLLHWSHQNHQRPDRILPNFHMCVCVSQAWHLPFLFCIKMMDWWWCFGVWGISVGCIHQNRQSIVYCSSLLSFQTNLLITVQVQIYFIIINPAASQPSYKSAKFWQNLTKRSQIDPQSRSSRQASDLNFAFFAPFFSDHVE